MWATRMIKWASSPFLRQSTVGIEPDPVTSVLVHTGFYSSHLNVSDICSGSVIEHHIVSYSKLFKIKLLKEDVFNINIKLT